MNRARLLADAGRTRADPDAAFPENRYHGFLPSQLSIPARPAILMLTLSLTPAFWPASLAAQGAEYVKANYTKYEFRIPMRDRARLFTAVYVPKDRSQTYPILLSRTPYSVQPYGEDAFKSDIGPSQLFGNEGYIVAYQDVRGRWMSEGEFVNMRPHKDAKSGPADIDESTDTFDTIDWLIKNVPNHNGKVGMWGISYPGFYTSAGMIDAHPALKAASPQAPIADWFAGDDWHHNGALFLPARLRFPRILRPPPSRADQERTARAVRLRDTRRLHLLPPVGTTVERQQEVLQGRGTILERDDAAREL